VVRLGVLSDIHGNRTALEAVIADGRDRGVDTWWALGDLVAIGPDPVDTLELLANVSKVFVTRGNTERYVLTRDRPPPDAEDVRAHPELVELFATVEASFSWTRGAVAAHGWLPWLAALPLEARTELDDGTRLLGVHASPGRNDGAGITRTGPKRTCACRSKAPAPTSCSRATPTSRPTAASATSGRSTGECQQSDHR
jgi:Calcineurin-like phosphoesterase